MTETDAGQLSDSKTQRSARYNKRIDIHHADELRNWSKSLGVLPEKIKAAVDKVGTSAEKVREHLSA